MAVIHPVLIYLAGPQDDVDQDTARGWREELGRLAPSGVAFFSPAHAYLNVNTMSFPAVDRMNREAINQSHALIANLSGPGRGFGTIREIEFALSQQTAVWVVGDVGHALMTWDLHVCDTLEEALYDVLHKLGEAREAMAAHPFSRLFGIQPDPPSED